MATFSKDVQPRGVEVNTTYLFFIIAIPLLTILFVVFVYNYYAQYSKTKNIIELLSDNNNMILDAKKKGSVNLENQSNWLREKLDFAGFLQPGSEYIFVVISLVFGALVSFFMFTIINNMIALIFSFLLFSSFPLLVLMKVIKNREEEFNFSLKEIIDKVTSMMRSGVGFEQALKKSVITSKSEFTKEVFNIYLNEKGIIGEDKAFEKMFKLVNSKELRIFYLTISIGRQSGGKFSNTLEKLRKTLHDQGEIKQEITASTKEIKVGSYMILALVVFIYMMMNSSLNGTLNAHFFGSDEGKIQFFFICMWVAFGLFVNNMLTKVK